MRARIEPDTREHVQNVVECAPLGHTITRYGCSSGLPRMIAPTYSRGSCLVDAVSMAARASATLPSFALSSSVIRPPAFLPRTCLPRRNSSVSGSGGGAEAGTVVATNTPECAPLGAALSEGEGF